MRGAWERVGSVVGAALLATMTAGGARGGTATPSLERLMLDDFEAPGTARYGPLDRTVPPRRRGRVEWSSTPCTRSGAPGRCLRLAYDFDTPEASEVSFRIDVGDVDASRFDHLELWIRGDEAAGFSRSLKIGLRRPKGGASALVEDGTAVLDGIEGAWKHFLLPLSHLAGIRDRHHVTTFFVALEARRAGASRRGVYEIDDVALVRTGSAEASVWDEVVPRKKLEWQKSVGGAEAARRRVRARMAGWPSQLVADRRTLPDRDDEFLASLARDTWQGIAAFTDRDNGLPVDHVDLAGDPPGDESRVGDYTNVTNVGLNLLATVAAEELGLVSREDALRRLSKVLATLDALETHHGFFFNYYDTTTLERTSNLLSFVDSSWLTAGLIVVRGAFPELHEVCTRRIEAQSYRFFYDEVAQQMSHGYYVNVPTPSEYHYGALYTEARLGSLLAIGKGDAPEDHWFALVRTYPPEIDWQTQRPLGVRVKRVHGHSFEGGYYQWREWRFVPSWGGSMFEALMPTLVLDEARYAPKSLGRNDETHARIQLRYAVDELGYPVWGLSPSADPAGQGYGEYGVKVLGTLGYGGGAVAPYAAALALAVLPNEATANLRQLAARYDAYGPYGFYDSVDPRSGAVAHRYLALDQSMVLVALANHLKGGCIQKRFAADPIVRRALPVIADEDFLD